MNIDLEYNVKWQEGETKVSNPELTIDYLSFGVYQKYEKGLDGQLRRIWGRIQRKFDTAVETKQYKIILEDSEKDFIKKAFEEAKYPAKLAKYIFVIEEEISNWN